MKLRKDWGVTAHDFQPWYFWRNATDEEIAEQLSYQKSLAETADISYGDEVFVSPLASVAPERLRLGTRSYIAAHAYLTGTITTGEHCTINPFTAVRGNVTLGDAVRIGAHTSLIGFNHSFAPDKPVFRQPTTSKGITVGDDVWIGSHVVVVDGVTIGSHAVLGAGAVVTKDVPEWAIVAGNPARFIRDRRGSTPTNSLDGRLAEFADRARAQASDVLDRCWDGERFLDKPDAKPTVRAWCDAVEIADLLLSAPPPHSDSIADHLKSLQRKDSGLVPEYGEEPSLDSGAATYHVLCVGYALELLGTTFDHPIQSAADLSSRELIDRLDALPWDRRAWSSGHWVDCIGTAACRNLVDFDLRMESETLFGWLLTRADPVHGMWGQPDAESRLHQVVNGFYRLTRGTFAQFGVPLPYPERAVDTLLVHARDGAYFGPDRGTACNVLDVIHPLWLCAKQTNHRRDEAREWAARQLDRALSRWVDGAGFSFAAEPGSEPDRTPGLQGTEMWLAIIWLLADYLGMSNALGYRPRGVHRPEPAASLTSSYR